MAACDIDDAAAEELASTLRVLADPARLRLLGIIGRAGEACVCDLTSPVGLSQPTISHHLRLLRDAGFIRREQRGKWAFYALEPGAMDRVATAMRHHVGTIAV